MRRIIVALLVALVVPLVAVGHADAVGEPVYGTVTAEGAPLGGVTMWLTSSRTGTHTTETRVNGEYELTESDGDYILHASKLGYESRTQAIVLDAANPQQIDIDLVPVDDFAFTGRLVDSAGLPVAGSIEASPVLFDTSTPLYSTTPTAADGTFTVDVPGGIGYSLHVKAPGYRDVHLEVGGSQDMGDIVMPLGAVVSGVVRNSSGAPIAGARVDGSFFGSSPSTTLTDADGTYSLQLGAPGNYQISVLLDGYLPWYVADGAVIAYPAGITPLDDVVLLRGGTLTGVVTDPTGDPVPNVTVFGDILDGPGGFQTQTGPDGRYTIEGNLVGGVRISAFAPRSEWANAVANVEVAEGPAITTQDLQFVFAPTATIALRTASGAVDGSLPSTGVAACEAPGLPSPTVFFSCLGGPPNASSWAGFGFADLQGVTPLTGLQPGEYNVIGFVDGVGQPGVLQLSLAAGDALDCTLYVDDSRPSGCGLGGGDEDLDGIDAAIEDGVGDGNDDGTPDSAQAHVASTTDPTGGNVTIAAANHDFQLEAVAVTDPATVPNPPAGVMGGSGIVGFTVGLPAGTTDATIEVFLDDPTGEINSYWKFQASTWVEVPATFEPASDGRTRATFTLTDGGPGDADGVTNGEIVDPGLFAITDRVGPVVTCPPEPRVGLNASAASIQVAVSDEGSGVAAPTIAVPVDTGTAGARTVQVLATDVLGNTTTTNCGYRVVYGVRWLVPTDPSGLHSLQANRTTGFSFRVVDANGAGVTGRVVTAPTSQPVACPGGRPKALVGVSGAPVATATVGGGWWVAGWRPNAQWKNTCRQVQIALNDGTTQSVIVKVT